MSNSKLSPEKVQEIEAIARKWSSKTAYDAIVEVLTACSISALEHIAAKDAEIQAKDEEIALLKKAIDIRDGIIEKKDGNIEYAQNFGTKVGDAYEKLQSDYTALQSRYETAMKEVTGMQWIDSFPDEYRGKIIRNKKTKAVFDPLYIKEVKEPFFTYNSQVGLLVIIFSQCEWLDESAHMHVKQEAIDFYHWTNEKSGLTKDECPEVWDYVADNHYKIKPAHQLYALFKFDKWLKLNNWMHSPGLGWAKTTDTSTEGGWMTTVQLHELFKQESNATT